MDFPLIRCVEGTRIRRSRRIQKFRKIKTQLLCGEHPYWLVYYFLGGAKDIIRRLDRYFSLIINIKRKLVCATLV